MVHIPTEKEEEREPTLTEEEEIPIVENTESNLIDHVNEAVVVAPKNQKEAVRTIAETIPVVARSVKVSKNEQHVI